jgi:putative ABC transport system permease protein
MLDHYLKTIFRNLAKQKLNSAINILGLSLGLAISLLIWIFVLHQLSYDRFISDHNSIYRIHSNVTLGQGDPQIVPTAMFPIGEQAFNDFPEIENFVRFTSYYSSPEILVEGEVETLTGILFADSTFFTIFNFPFLAGNPETALIHPSSLVLTKSTSERFFGGSQNALNKQVSIQGRSFQITGVIENLPDNTHLQFNAMSNHESLPESVKISGTNFFTYLKLRPGANISELEKKLDATVESHIKSNPLYQGLHFVINNKLMKLTDIHLHSNLVWELKSNGSHKNVLIFTILAIFILFIAIINYVNLATARSNMRSKELGMRKVVGASRGKLIHQILFESLVITLISFFLAFALYEIFAGFFSQSLGIHFKTAVLLSPKGMLVVFMFLLFTSFLAGLYPAIYMAAFDPVKILKGEMVKGTKGKLFRRILVIFQFSITIFIISSLLLITKQLRYMQATDLGFDKEQVLIVRNVSSNIWRSFPEVRHELESRSGIIRAAGANFIYGAGNRIDMIAEKGVSKESGVTADILTIDSGFLDVMGIELIQGRNFDPDSEIDLHEGFILNQTAVKALAMEDPLNKPLDLFGRQGPLIGIIKDFNLKSLHQPVEPLVFIFAKSGFPHVYLKVTPGDFGKIQQEITEVLNAFDPAYVPDIIFMDDRIQSLYHKEKDSATLLSTGALLAIIISILGVYGLASFSAERRIKEIGIRKILGASLPKLLWEFNRESVILVVIAFVLASPLAWLAMDVWLNNFVVRVTINPLWFILPGLAAMLLSAATISIQAWITARANPIEALRAE